MGPASGTGARCDPAACRWRGVNAMTVSCPVCAAPQFEACEWFLAPAPHFSRLTLAYEVMRMGQRESLQ